MWLSITLVYFELKLITRQLIHTSVTLQLHFIGHKKKKSFSKYIEMYLESFELTKASLQMPVTFAYFTVALYLVLLRQ